MRILELNYSNTNSYLIEGSKGKILFDTGWAGTFQAFCSVMGGLRLAVQDVDYIFISHFHPDHMGIAQEIADLGPVIVVMDVQKDFIHAADSVLEKDRGSMFKPIIDDRVLVLSIEKSRELLRKTGIDGEIIYTPGHSEDSISLVLDSGEAFVGDLNPLYELELYKGTRIEESWNSVFHRNPRLVYYGHARPAVLGKETAKPTPKTDRFILTSKIMRYLDKGVPLDRIQRKTGASAAFIDDVARMYLTHQNVGVQGILDRIEIKGK